MPSSGTLRRRYRAVSPSACSANVTFAQPGSGQRNRRTAKYDAVPGGRPPRHRPPPGRTRHAPARTPPRTPGTAPAGPGSTPTAPPPPRYRPPGRPAARQDAGTTGTAVPRPARKPPGHGRRRSPPSRTAWQTDAATRLPGTRGLGRSPRPTGASFCHITPTRRARTRSSHQTPAATPAKPNPAPPPPSPTTKIAQEPETPDPRRSNAVKARFQCVRQRPIFMINLSSAKLSQDRAARCRSSRPVSR